MRSAVSSPLGWRLTTALLAAFWCGLPATTAITFNPVPASNIDLSQLGRVALAGDFDSISLYQWEGQNQRSFSTNGSSSVLARFPNGAFASIQNADGSIRSMCPFVLKNGALQGVVVGGNFTSLGGVETQAVALFNPNTSAITPLPGLSGKVTSVYCDNSSSTVYVGGSFSGANSTNAIVWTTGWTNLPFAGFNGEVRAITKAPSGHIIFAGSFDGLGNTTTPKNKDEQSIPLVSANISSSASSTTPGFNDPRNIICKTGSDGPGNTWLLADQSPGFWQANFRFGFNPTKIRLYNTAQSGRGTKTFRVTALPINGIMNLTYTNPQGQTVACDARCPLPENNSTFQDFHFVNSVGMNGFRLDISDWYGSGAGLSGIELFEDDIYAFAINDFNDPKCGSTSASATVLGNWAVQPSGATNSDYLRISLPGPNIDPATAQIVFEPNIKQSGNYTVTVFTPGCIQDNTCSSRGRVNITGIMGSGTQSAVAPVTTELFQTNNFDKYDQIYYGYVDASSSSFRPRIILQPSAGQTGPLTVVAQRVRFELQTSTGGLNGLFEFNPNVATVDTDFSKSAVDTAGMGLNPGAIVHVVTVQGQDLYVAGNFSSPDYSNVFTITGGNNATSLPGGGLNSGVMTAYNNGSAIFFGGNFTNTRDNNVQGLNGVCAYSISDKTWQPLGAGVNGIVTSLVSFTLNFTANQPELAIAVTGSFSQVMQFDQNSAFQADNFAVWIPSRRNWLQNLGLSNIALSGKLTAQTNIPGSMPIYAGSVSSQSLEASGAVGLSGNGGLAVQKIPGKIQPQQSSGSLQKRDIGDQNIFGVVTGLIYEQSNLNITILGGHFSASATNGSVVNNLLFFNGSNNNQVTGIGSNINPNSTFTALGYHGTTLFAGGNLAGNIGNNQVSGLVLYDLRSAAVAPAQPPTLTGPSVVVNAIAAQPSAAAVFVGGSFDGAGTFSCPSLCMWDTDRGQWASPGLGLGGSVSALSWTSNTRLVVAGNITVGGAPTTMAIYDTVGRNFTAFTGASSVPGPVTALCTASNDGTQFWVAGKATNGSTFLEKYDGSQWLTIGQGLGPGTTIRGLQVLMVSKNHGNTPLLPKNQILLVLGELELPNFGAASGAIFNGTTFQPFLLSNTVSNVGGSISQIFVQNPGNVFKSGGGHLALGFIVLIGLGIALVLTFLLVVAGIVAERIRRKREGYMPAPTQPPMEQLVNTGRVPPEQLLSSIGPHAGRSIGRI